jgi:N-formylglutamate deformylase
MDPYIIHAAKANQVPIVISVPHCGTLFPGELEDKFKPELVSEKDDTDFFVDQLYDFAPEMGMSMITAVYSRWVVDLNRDPEDKPLYSDGRIITGVCPVTDFKGESLYVDGRKALTTEETNERITNYFNPYHEALSNLLNLTQSKFGKVLLWDCHSIRKEVPTIFQGQFPDLILGDNDGFAAGRFLQEMASKSLSDGDYSFKNNFLFKGGYITRHYGQPSNHQHALQLEMTKINYMDDEEKNYDKARADKMRDHLKRTFEKLITLLSV